MPRKPKVLCKFGEMRYGQWFKEVSSDRTFVKLQNILPSGIPITYGSFVGKDHTSEDGKEYKEGDRIHRNYFNAVDQDGMMGCCPDWIQFELIDSPVPQRLKHDHGKNMKIPRYPGDKQGE